MQTTKDRGTREGEIKRHMEGERNIDRQTETERE